MRQILIDNDYAAWRQAAKEAMRRSEAPNQVSFVEAASAQTGLFAPTSAAAASPTATPGQPVETWRLPRAFVQAAPWIVAHRSPTRFDDLYRVLWRLTHGEPALLQMAADPDVQTMERMRRQVERDVHKCHAFVRFRAVAQPQAPDEKHYIAWYEPDHRILALAVPHFVERFANMQWTILTPDASASFAKGVVRYGPGAKRDQAPAPDELEALWKTYYASIFNPARLNTRMQRQEMPQRFWRNAPEAELNRELTRTANARAQAFMRAQPSRAEPKETYPDLSSVTDDLKQCQACAWAHAATQAVGGEGPSDAAMMLVGEQPGDQEDRADRPFVGPAGQLLDRALLAAGIARREVYVTNAVKHFKFEARGKRRLHSTPSHTDVAACRGWLSAELQQVRPQILVCLGLTAALSVFGKAQRLHQVRGRWQKTAACAQTLVTAHPSAILRMPTPLQADAFDALVADLRQAKLALKA